MIARRLLAVAGVVVATALLTACPSPPPTPTTSTSSSAPPTSTPAPTQGLAAEIAFAVGGTLLSPDGATEIGFRMTVSAPESGSTGGQAAFAGSTHCSPVDLAGAAPAVSVPEYVTVTFESTLLSGNADGAEAIITTTTAAQTWEGGYATFQAFCADPLAIVPGTAQGTLLVEAGVDAGQNGWIPDVGGYGLSAYVVDPATMEATAFQVTACAIEFGPASVGTVAATIVPVDTAYSCTYGLLDSP